MYLYSAGVQGFLSFLLVDFELGKRCERTIARRAFPAFGGCRATVSAVDIIFRSEMNGVVDDFEEVDFALLVNKILVELFTDENLEFLMLLGVWFYFDIDGKLRGPGYSFTASAAGKGQLGFDVTTDPGRPSRFDGSDAERSRKLSIFEAKI